MPEEQGSVEQVSAEQSADDRRAAAIEAANAHAVEPDGGGDGHSDLTGDEVLDDILQKSPKKAEKKKDEVSEAVEKLLAGDEPAEKPAAKPDFDKKAERLQKILERRDKQIAEKQKLSSELERQRQAVAQQAREIEQERARLRKEAEYVSLLKKDPTMALKESGLRPEEFLLQIAEGDSPDAQLRKKLREQGEQLEQIRSWQKRQEEERAQREAKAREDMAVQHRASTVEKFKSIVLNEEVSPHLAAMYSDNVQALVFEGDMVAYQYRQETGGDELSVEDIALILEYRAAERYRRVEGKKRAGTVKAEPSVAEKPKSQAKPPRTITSDMASERKSSTKRLHDMSDDERRELAKRAVEAVTRKSG